MKMKLLVLLSIVCLFSISCSLQKTNDIKLDKELKNLLITKDFFKLRERLILSKDKLSEDRYLYYKAFCNDAFNKSALSQKCITTLLRKYKEQLNDTILADLLEIESRNHTRMFQHKKVLKVAVCC